MRIDSRRRAPTYAFSILLLGQAILFASAPWPNADVGDEPDFRAKAQALLEGHLPRASVASRPALDHKWGVRSDYRPLGYAAFVAAANAVSYRPALFRYRAAALQFVAMCGVLWWIHVSLQRFASAAGVSMGRRLLIAVIVGIQPWTFEYARSILSDSLTAAIVTAGLLCLLEFLRRSESSSQPWLIVAGGILGLALLLRPEMIAVTPLPVVFAFLLKRLPTRAILRAAAAIGTIWMFILAAQVFYRWHLFDRLEIYGDFVFPERGAYEWTHTWVGSERQNYGFVNDIDSGLAPTTSIPDRAFAGEAERAEISRAIELVRACRCYTREVDEIFSRIAAEHVRESPTRSFLLPRLWRTLHLWLNLETNDQLLLALSGARKSVRTAILGGLLVLKGATYLLAVFAVTQAWISRREGSTKAWNEATLMMGAWVVARTVLMGVVLGWGVHRYVLPAWPAMLWCAGMGLLRFPAVGPPLPRANS